MVHFRTRCTLSSRDTWSTIPRTSQWKSKTGNVIDREWSGLNDFTFFHRFSAIEEKKSKMLNLSYSSFSYVTKLLNNANRIASDVADSSDVNDEKWLCHYMLGKIAEKRKEDPKVYLNHYLMVSAESPSTIETICFELFFSPCHSLPITCMRAVPHIPLRSITATRPRYPSRPWKYSTVWMRPSSSS